MTIYHTPYTYLIGWSNHNTFYYGVRYARDCHPNDLWESYFTSSDNLKDFHKQHGDPDIIQVRKTFNDAKSAVIWEEKVLRKIFASGHWDKWINGNISGAIIMTEEIKSKISKANKGRSHGPLSKEHREKMSKSLRGRVRSDETRERIRHAQYLHSDETKKKRLAAVRTAIAENKEKGIIKVAPSSFMLKVSCPKCGKEAQKANISKWHGLDGEKCRW